MYPDQRPRVVLLNGAQIGDEGKGKLVHVLCSQGWFDICVRSQGGHNAGHTVWPSGKEFKLNLFPSGILAPNVTMNILGGGMVIDIKRLWEEQAELKGREVDLQNRFLISSQAHIIFPYHRALDTMWEAQRPDPIGTTARGIGPAYEEKYGRRGIRMEEVADAARFRERIMWNLERNNKILAAFGHDCVSDDFVDEYVDIGQKFAPYVTNTTEYLQRAIRKDLAILVEGAQGTRLDINHGKYPNVTSSSPSAAGMCDVLGIPIPAVSTVLGACKPYKTGVGKDQNSSVSLMEPEIAAYVGREGKEVGTTTGRNRQCSWLDAEEVRQSVALNGISELGFMKLDIFDNLPEIKICTNYKLDGKILETMPTDIRVIAQCEPVYETHEGWMSSTRGIRDICDLPVQARKYVTAAEKACGANIGLISVGPIDDENIVVPGSQISALLR